MPCANFPTELSLVVAEFFDWEWQRILDLCLLHLVLYLQAAHHWLCIQLAILQLQPFGLCRLWSFGGDSRLFGCVCLCAASL